jgi:hypothetical protein
MLVVVIALINMASYEAFAATIITACSMFVTVLSRPYKFAWLDVVDGAGHLVIIVNIQIGLAFCGHDSNPGHSAVGASVAIILLTVGWRLVLLYLLKRTFVPPALLKALIEGSANEPLLLSDDGSISGSSCDDIAPQVHNETVETDVATDSA